MILSPSFCMCHIQRALFLLLNMTDTKKLNMTDTKKAAQ